MKRLIASITFAVLSACGTRPAFAGVVRSTAKHAKHGVKKAGHGVKKTAKVAKRVVW